MLFSLLGAGSLNFLSFPNIREEAQIKVTYIFEWPCRLNEIIHVSFSYHLHYHNFDDLILSFLILTIWSCWDTEVLECLWFPHLSLCPCPYWYSNLWLYMDTLTRHMLFQTWSFNISFHVPFITQPISISKILQDK